MPSMKFNLLPLSIVLYRYATHAGIMFVSSYSYYLFLLFADIFSRRISQPYLPNFVRYNESTETFENMRFNAIRYRNGHVIDVPSHYLQGRKNSPAACQEFLGNTLLHLVAGSDTLDISMLEYCISTIGIDKDVRNADGATPLLLAC